jgi:hypothetical protein
MDEYTQPKKRILNLSNAGLIVIVVLAILFLGTLGTTYYFYQKAHSITSKDPQKELEQTIKMVGKHLVLPTNETPTMATVSDPEKLKDQAFFANAKKGDKVLIYANSQKAILYDPEADRIVEVAPINTSTANQAQNAPVVQTTTTKK